MATNVKSLKNLYVTLGGNAADVANLDSNSEMIEALRNVAGGGGGGSSRYFEIDGTATFDEATGAPAVSLNKTFAEIMAAMEAGKVPVCFIPLYGYTQEFALANYIEIDGEITALEFSTPVSAINYDATGVYSVVLSSDNECTADNATWHSSGMNE